MRINFSFLVCSKGFYYSNTVVNHRLFSANSTAVSRSENKRNAAKIANPTSTAHEASLPLLKSTPSLFFNYRQARFGSIRKLASKDVVSGFRSTGRLFKTSAGSSLLYARRRVASVFRRGQRSKRERAVRSIGVPTFSRGSFSTASQRRERFRILNSNANPAATALLRPLPLVLPPFVALRIRRRTKRAAPRIRHLSRLEGQRIALRNLAKSLQRPSRRLRQPASASSSASSASAGSNSSLHTRLVRTLSALSSSINKPNSSSLREARQEIHQQAYKARPRS